MGYTKAMYSIYFRLQKLIAPSLKYSQDLYKDTLISYIKKDSVWLELGCGHQILPVWYLKEEKELVKKCKRIVGFDYTMNSLLKHESIKLKVRGDITTLPFNDNSFDLITSNMVIEHLQDPLVQFKEIARILRPGGTFIFHTPNIYGYPNIFGRFIPESLKNKIIYILQGRKEDDVFDTYYRANSRAEISKLAESAGLGVEKIRMLVSSAQFIVFPPLVIPELLWIRLLMTEPFRPLRTNIIAILKKP